MPPTATRPPRNRLHVAIAIVATITLGLASRKFPALQFTLLGKYPGDALWALTAYGCVAWLRPAASTRTVAVCALVISYADELSQLYQAPWLNHLRATTVGHLFLGSVFSWFDLLAYTIGVAIGALIETLITRYP